MEDGNAELSLILSVSLSVGSGQILSEISKDLVYYWFSMCLLLKQVGHTTSAKVLFLRHSSVMFDLPKLFSNLFQPPASHT